MDLLIAFLVMAGLLLGLLAHGLWWAVGVFAGWPAMTDEQLGAVMVIAGITVPLAGLAVVAVMCIRDERRR